METVEVEVQSHETIILTFSWGQIQRQWTPTKNYYYIRTHYTGKDCLDLL
jgi:hypothetical protein